MSEEKRIPSTGRFERSATRDWPRGAEANVPIEEPYRLIVEIAYDAIISIDERGQILFANPSTERIFGYDPAELVGRPLEVLMPESLRPSHRAGLERYCRTYERHINWRGVKMTGLRKDGTEFPIEISFGEITREGRPVFIGFVKDITERKRAEEVLLAERHLLRTLIDNMPDYIYVKDTESRFLVANRHLAEVVGLKGPEALIGKTDFDFFPEKLAASYFCDEQAIVQSGQALVNQEEKTTDGAGNERWLLTTKVPLQGSDGKVIGILGMGRDITERKQAESALRRANDKLAEEKAQVEQTARELKLFRALIDESNDAIEVVDPLTLRFLDVNEKACQMLGYTRQELLSLRVTDTDPDANQFELAKVKEILERSGFVVFESVHQRKDGSTFPIEISLRLVRLERNYVVNVVRDISERRRAESAVREANDKLVEEKAHLEQTARELKLFRTLIDESNDAIVMIDQQTLRFLDVNEKACRDLGYTRQELLSLRIPDIDPGFNISDFAKSSSNLKQLGFAIFETVHKRKDGSAFPVEISVRLVRFDREVTVCVVRDITERKCAEERLQRLNRTLQSLSECTETLMKATDESSMLQQVCDSVVQVGGYRMAWVGYTEHDEYKSVRPVAQAGFEEGYLDQANVSWADVERGHGPGGISIRTGKVVVCNDVGSDARFAPWREEALLRRYHSLIVLPLRNENEVFGCLAIYAAEADAFDSREQRLLEQLANNMIYAIMTQRARMERQKATYELKAERQRFLAVLDSLPAMIGLLTPNHDIVFANQRFRKVFGESQGRKCYEYAFGAKEPCEFCEAFRVLGTNVPHEWELSMPNGMRLHVFDMPFADADGSPLVLEMDVDVTKERETEEKLKRASLYSRGLIEASLDPLVTINREGKITDVNEATELVTGVARERLIGTDFCDYFTEPEKARQGYQRVFAEGLVLDYPLAILHASGRVTHVLYNASVFRNERGEIAGIFAAARDITERKRIEEELRSLSGKLLRLQDEERRKISRELHDSTGQNLTALAANLDEARKSVSNSNGRARKLLSESLKLTEDCIREVRTLSYLLHPPMLDATGLEDAIRHYISGFSMRTGVHVDLQFSPRFKRLMPDVELALFRVLQESLINVQRHSNSKEAWVRLERHSKKITMEIEDRGHEVSTGRLAKKEGMSFEGGVGIPSMRERLKIVGGNLEIVAGRRGTTVRATLPVEEEEHEKSENSNS